ncbi:MAG: protein-L-isoaspartate(D-aspartate) O-methyltransferase [bacterium]|nr:protein-L-isoaspartate(D-aspartate) O-methyltransferase [bacterium]
MAGCVTDKPSQVDKTNNWAEQRSRMVRTQIQARGIRSKLVLDALGSVPRHEFVPQSVRDSAYADSPLPIGEAQTISQPYIVALMSELLQVEPGGKVLEIGTGSGYQAAILAAMGVEVYSMEIVTGLCERAQETFDRLKIELIHVQCGDGYRGWPEEAPFDGVIVTAAPDKIPEPLLKQLAIGGRMVIPVGPFNQDLKVITRTKDGFEEESIIPVRFVPMTGEIEKQ